MGRAISLFVISLIIAIVLFLNGCVSETSGNELQLYFHINETNESLSGELISGNVSLGAVIDGRINIPKEELNISKITLKTRYQNKNYSFDYDFLESYLGYGKMDFIVSLEDFNGYAEADKMTGLYFYDRKTNCSLSGEASVDNIKVGTAKAGLLQLNYQEYLKLVNKDLCVYGNYGKCFGASKDFSFDYCWAPRMFTEEDFKRYSPMQFYIDFDETDVRAPSGRAVMAFVRPEETAGVVKELIYNPSDSKLDVLGKLSSLLDSKFTYLDDDIVYGRDEYWATPAEFLAKHEGDCEDWTNAFLSSILYYDPSLKCYNLLLSTHVTNFCYLGDFTYSFMDQSHVKLSATLDGKEYMPDEVKKLRELRDSYLDDYGISANEGSIVLAYSNKEYIKFKDNEDFIRWAIKFSYPNYNLP